MMRRAALPVAFASLAILLHLAMPGPAAAAKLFANDPLVATLSIKAVDITELRALINALRAVVPGPLAPFVFTDSNLTGVVVKGVHVSELRTALNEAYTAASRPLPVYTDPTIVAGQTVIKAVHINEVRAAILSLDQQVSGTINLGNWHMGTLWAQLDNGAFTWAADPSSTLPPGLSLRTDVPSFFPAGVLAGVIGVPTDPGTYIFSVLRDGTPRRYRMRIVPAAFKDYFRAPDGFVNTPYSYQLTMTNAIGAVTWAANPPSSVPAGMTLSAAGLLSGTPTAAGNYQVNFTATDSVATNFSGIQLQVFAIRIPTNGSLPNATQGVPYTPTTITASGGSGGYTFTSNGPPNGLTLNPSTGVISGTPTQNATHWTFNVTATDSSMQSYNKPMSIVVVGAPTKLPALQPAGSSFLTNFFDDCTLGQACVLQTIVNSGGRAPFSWTANGLPPGMDSRSGSGLTTYYIQPENLELWGAPMQLGTFPTQLKVQDPDGQSATNMFDVRVSPMALTQYLSSGNVGTPYSSYLQVIGGRLPYTAAIVARRLPLGLTLNPNTLTVTGTPTEAGNYAPVLEFTDADGKKLRVTSYMSVGPFQNAVTIFTNFDDLGTITAGFSYSNQLIACCVTTTWSLNGGSGPLPPGLTLSTGGLISGTPTVGTSGTFTFVVRATDPITSNFGISQLTITVTPMSVTSTNLPVGHVGSAYNGSIIVSGFTGSVSGALEPFQYMPPGLTFNSDGTVTGTPTASGQFSFTARATDSAGHILIRTFTINVYPAGVNPPLDLNVGGPTFTSVVGGFSDQLQAAAGTPPYTYSVTPAAPQVAGLRVQNGPPLPTFFTVSPDGTGGLLGVLTATGTYQTSIRATDHAGGFIDRPITINVTPLRNLSLTFLPDATVGVPYSFTFTPFGGSSYVWSGSNLPPGLSLNPSTGTLSGTPTSTVSFNGMTITLSDTVVSGFDSERPVLNVDPFAIVAGTNGVLPNGTVGSAYNTTGYQLTTSPANCGSGCTWTFQNGQIPNGMNLSAAGLLSGTPTATFAGSFQAMATGSLGTVVKTVSIRIVASSPQPLAITNGATFGDTTIGVPTFIGLFASGGTEPYTWSLDASSLDALPPGMAFRGPGETLGFSTAPGYTYLVGRPLTVKNYSLTIAVTDSAAVPAKVTKTFTWNVSPLSSQYNNLPLSGSTLKVGVPYNQPLLFTGGSGSYTFSVASGVLPAGLTLDPATGVISGTPTTAQSVFPFIKATDALGKSLSQSISFNVSP
jgi:hypothetical protein